MIDPPRPEVPQGHGQVPRAGIRIVMVTGDFGLTALAMAREIGLRRTENPRVVTGEELNRDRRRGPRQILKEEVIFARISPEHKLRIVAALRHLGEVVAVTGDGVNDGPALKKADIGVAMGHAGHRGGQGGGDDGADGRQLRLHRRGHRRGPGGLLPTSRSLSPTSSPATFPRQFPSSRSSCSGYPCP